MASDATDYAAIHAKAIRLAARLADLGRRMNAPNRTEFNADAAGLIHQLRDDPDLLVQVVTQNRALLEPAVFFVLRSNSAADDLQATVRFVRRLLKESPAAETDLFRALWIRFGGAEFVAATCGSFLHALLGPLEINLDLDLQAVVRTVDDGSMIPSLASSSNAPNAPAYFSFARSAPVVDGAGHVQERTRMIRRRLEARTELCTGIVLELIRAIYRGLDAFPPGFIIALKTLRDKVDDRDDAGSTRRRIRQVFLDAVFGIVLDKPDCFDFIPQYFLSNLTRSSLKQLSQIVACLGSGSMTVGCSAHIINAFIEEHGVLVDQLITDLLRPEELSVSSPLLYTPVQHCALSKSRLNAFMVAMARLSEAQNRDSVVQVKFPEIDEMSSSSKDLLLSCFDQFDMTLKPMPLRPVESGPSLTTPPGGLARVLFECLSHLPVCGVVQSGDAFLHYLQQTVAFARLKAERHHSSDLCTVISHLSGFIGYALTVQPDVDWAQELTSYMDSVLSQHEQRINDHVNALDSWQLSLAIINNIIQNNNVTRDSLRAQQSVQNFIRNARFNFKVIIKNSKGAASQIRSFRRSAASQIRSFRRSVGRRSPSDSTEIQCRSLDQIVQDLRDICSHCTADVMTSVIDSILKKIAVSVEQDLAGIPNSMRFINTFLMGRLYPHLFASSSSSDTENETLQDQLVRFSDITLEHLDIPSSHILQTVLLLPISEIGKINLFISPSKKIECIVRATRQAMDALRLNVSDSVETPGSDLLLPVMVFVILKARPAELNRNCSFCRLFWNADDDFIDRHDLQSLYRFCFVQFLSAVKFILDLSPDSLTIPAPRTSDETSTTRNAWAA